MIESPYPLKREDSKEARFYWLRDGNVINKYIGITSLASLCLPDSEELIRWQITRDPDGRLLSLSADHGTLEHKVADHFDKGLEWQHLIPQDYSYERMIKGSLLAWHKFRQDYKVEILASELMLKFQSPVNQHIRYACTLDKIAWITETKKEKQVVETGEFYKSGKNKGKPKTKQVTTEVEVKSLAIIDLKSNFFQKDTKTFYESHLFQLWGQRKALRQAFAFEGIMGEALPETIRIFNFSPNNWRTRSENFDNMYTLKEWTEDYSIDFEEHLVRAERKGWLEPKGRIEVFMPFTKETPVNEAYKAMTYDEYVEYKEQLELQAQLEQQKKEEELIEE